MPHRLVGAFYRDTRALTVAFIKLLMSLGLGAAVLWVMFRTMNDLLPDAKDTAPGGLGGVQMNDWFELGDQLLPFIFLLVAFFGFIVNSVYERRRVR